MFFGAHIVMTMSWRPVGLMRMLADQGHEVISVYTPLPSEATASSLVARKTRFVSVRIGHRL